MQASRYFLPQGSLSMKPDNRALVAALLTPWYKPRCLKCHQPHSLYRCQSQILAAYYSLGPSLCYSVPTVIHERCCESSIFWAIRTCRLVYLLDVTLEKDWETWLLICNSAWFWGICYSAKRSYPVHSFETWLLYWSLILKLLCMVEVLLANNHQLSELGG